MYIYTTVLFRTSSSRIVTTMSCETINHPNELQYLNVELFVVKYLRTPDWVWLEANTNKPCFYVSLQDSKKPSGKSFSLLSFPNDSL